MEILARIRSSSGGGGLLQDMKKVVYKLDIPDATAKRKAMKAVSTLRGIDFIAIDIKAKTLTVIGLADPVDVVSKLRKAWQTDIISVGPAKEPEKPKEEPKKEEAKKEEKKEEPKKEEAKKEEAKGEGGKKEEPKKEEPKKEEEKKKDQPAPIVVQEIPHEEILKAYPRAYYPPPYTTTYYYAHSMEENPNACVIT